jgi:hypothetical protein
MNGAPSLSGVYAYPQLAQWQSIDGGKQQDVYNRYAHAEFVIDRRANSDSTKLNLAGPDHFQVITTPCSSYLQKEDVHFLLTTEQINSSCTQLLKKTTYPARTFYIYHIN